MDLGCQSCSIGEGSRKRFKCPVGAMGDEETSTIRDERVQFAAGAGVSFAGTQRGGERTENRARRLKPRQRLQVLAAGAWGALREDLAVEWARGTAFLCLPVFFGIGALIYFTLPFEPAWQWIVVGSLACAFAVRAAAGHLAVRLVLSAMLAVLAGVCAGKVETWRTDTSMMGSDLTTRMTGRVVRLEHRADRRVRLTVDVTATERPHLRYPPKRIRATARAVPPGLAPGRGVQGLVRLMAPSGPVRPGGYDFSFESYFDGLSAVGFFLGDPQLVALPTAPTLSQRFFAGIEHLRQRIATRVRSVIGGAEGEVAVALITGLRSGIPEPVNEALRRAGLAHILSISGLHMALVAFTAMTCIRTAFAFFPGFSSRHPVRKYAASAALVVSAAYLLLSGADVAARRSFIMLAVMLTALLFDRAAITMRNLAIAALVVLAVSPHEVVGPSFQMSFAATAALIAGYSAWSEWRARRLAAREAPQRDTGLAAVRALFRYGGGLAMTSLLAGIATALYAVWHFQRLAPLGLVGNLAAMPFMSVLVMPFGLLAAILMPFGLDAPALWVMGKGIAAVIAIADWVSAHTPLDTVGLVPASAVICLSTALVVLTISTTRIRLAAVVFLAAGGLLLVNRDLPDVLVSENARMVAIREADGAVSTNVARADDFIMGNWLAALGEIDFQRPKAAVGLTGPDLSEIAAGQGFVCGEKLCLARHSSGAIVASAADPALVRPLCGVAALIVLNDATARDTCARTATTVVTARDLARRGSVAIRLRQGTGKEIVATITRAVEMPWRPWHTQRAWSRAARGLPPYHRDD